MSCPSRFEYTIGVTAIVNGHLEQNHYKATYLAEEDYLHVFAFSAEEQRTVEAPHGTNIVVTLPGNRVLTGLSRALTHAIDREDSVTDLLGVPDLKPIYSFGLRRPRPREALASPTPSTPEESSARSGDESLHSIGTTYARSLDYEVDFVATEVLAGRQTYHLRLTPLRRPNRFRIRELWVDVSSYATVQVLSDGNFSTAPLTKVRWLTTYRDVSGCDIIESETALEVLDLGHNRKYDNTRLTFAVDVDATAYRTPIVIFRRPQTSDDLVEPDE